MNHKNLKKYYFSGLEIADDNNRDKEEKESRALAAVYSVCVSKSVHIEFKNSRFDSFSIATP